MRIFIRLEYVLTGYTTVQQQPRGKKHQNAFRVCRSRTLVQASYFCCLLMYVKVKVLVAQSCLTICNPRTVAHQAPLCMEFSRQESWSVEEGSRGREHMYTYGWFMLMCDRKQQNFVKQLSFD